MHPRPSRTQATRRRRVLLLNWRDGGHPQAGGSEHFVEQLATGLHGRGYDVTLWSAHFPGAMRRDHLDDVRIVRHGGKFTVYPRAMLHLLAHPQRYDLIIDVQNGVPFWSRLVTRTPVVVLVHHVHRDVWPVVFSPRLARFGWWLESRVAPRVYAGCRYATVSAATERELVALGVDPERITLVYNGCDLAQRPEVLARGDTPSLVVLGRLVPHKRVELAIEALAALRPDFPGVTLTVIGQGYWEQELRALSDRLQVSDAVTFTGFVDDETKRRLLATSWVHVLPSVKEGWGLAVFDAAVCGTPSVAFRSAGGTCESIIDGETGLLLDDDEALAERLSMLLRRPEMCRRLGVQAGFYASQFNWDHMVDRFEELAGLAIERDPSLSLPPTRPAAVVAKRAS